MSVIFDLCGEPIDMGDGLWSSCGRSPGHSGQHDRLVHWQLVTDPAPWPTGPVCEHAEWQPCSKHANADHDECVQCGALRFPVTP